MSEKNWPASLMFTWRPENDGQAYHVDPDDPGGATAWAVTHGTWAAAVEHGYVTGDLATAAKDQLSTVLHAMFWQAVQGASLPGGVDLVVWDMGVVAGPGRAARILQAAVGVEVDGAIGPITLAAVAAADARDLIGKLTGADMGFFNSLPDAVYFGDGWDRRASDASAAGLALVQAIS